MVLDHKPDIIIDDGADMSMVLHNERKELLSHIKGACEETTTGVQTCTLPILTISSSVISSSCLQSFPTSGSFQMSQFFASGGQSIGASASPSVLPMNIPDGFPLGLTDLIFLQSKGLSRVFSSTTVQKHQFFGAQLSLWSNSHPYMTTGKTIALNRWTFVSKVMSLLFNLGVYVGHSFSSKEQVSFNVMDAVTICSDFRAQKKSDTVSPVSPSISHEMMGADAMVFVF